MHVYENLEPELKISYYDYCYLDGNVVKKNINYVGPDICFIIIFFWMHFTDND